MIKNNLLSRTYHLGSESGFTLMEILVIISLLIILAAVLLVTLNPIGQINKGYDSKRRTELTQLGKVLEDYYNDHQCYPPPAKICYNAATQQADGSYICNICGNEKTSPSLSPYMNALPCDPKHPVSKYMYQVDNTTCPTVYHAYTLFTLATTEFCTPDNSGWLKQVYNWGISSPNTIPVINCSGIAVPTPTPTISSSGLPCSIYKTIYYNPFCNICGSQGNDGPPPAPYTVCKTNHPGETYYIDAGVCAVTCIPN